MTKTQSRYLKENNLKISKILDLTRIVESEAPLKELELMQN